MPDKAQAPCAAGNLYGGRPDILIWLLVLCAVLLFASFVMKTVWDGQDVDWLGIKLIAAGPKNETLRDVSAFLQQLFAGFLPALLVLCLSLPPLRCLLSKSRARGSRRYCDLPSKEAD